MEWGRAGYVQYKKGRWSGEERVRSSTKNIDEFICNRKTKGNNGRLKHVPWRMGKEFLGIFRPR
jgi:hypothetical protein